MVNLLEQAHDLIVTGANLFHRNIMVNDVNDACKIFAHICLNIIRLSKQLRNSVIEVCGNDSVQPAFFVVLIKFVKPVCK